MKPVLQPQASPDTVATRIDPPFHADLHLPPSELKAARNTPRLTLLLVAMGLLAAMLGGAAAIIQTEAAPALVRAKAAPVVQPKVATFLKPWNFRKRCETLEGCQEPAQTKPHRAVLQPLKRAWTSVQRQVLAVGGFFTLAVRLSPRTQRPPHPPTRDPHLTTTRSCVPQAIGNADLLLLGGASALITGL